MNLGLPSGTLWATMNVGASKPSDAGLYFQWGDTNGYSATQVGKDKQFTWSDYKFSIVGSSSNFSKYTTTGAKLELKDDAAHANMGGDWHMPTLNQIRELINKTDNTWTTTQDGVNGWLFTSKKDGSKSIFIPAAGDVWDGFNHNSGYRGGFVWSSTLNSGGYARRLYFHSGNVILDAAKRCYGLSVRGVLG